MALQPCVASKAVKRVQIPDFLIAPGIAALGLLLLVAVALVLPKDDIAGSPGAVSTMGTARWNHTATLLPNGKVLIVGGLARVAGAMMPVSLSSTELYDPFSNSWSSSGALTVARESHTATLLPSGKVLVVGGLGNSGALSDAELYDPSSEPGRRPARWRRLVLRTPRPYCSAARYWSRAEFLIAIPLSYTILPPTPGHPRAT